MFPTPLDLSGQTAPDVFDVLYPYFQRDFVAQRTCLARTIHVNPKAQGMRDGKEEVFWHITTREQKKQVRQGKKMVLLKSRPFDPDRACRIEWIRPMLIQHDHAEVLLFYRKETRGKKPIRLYLWAKRRDFVVIVQKLGRSSSYLVTSFYITETYKRASYQKWFDEYTRGSKPELRNCEWF